MTINLKIYYHHLLFDLTQNQGLSQPQKMGSAEVWGDIKLLQGTVEPQLSSYLSVKAVSVKWNLQKSVKLVVLPEKCL